MKNDSMNINETWDVTDIPEKQKVIGNKWVYRLKQGMIEEEKPRHKARLVAKGFSQI